MEGKVTQFWSVLVVTFSQSIIRVKKQCFYVLKLNSINSAVKLIEKIDNQSRSSAKNTASQAYSYMSINDFKPLTSIYSSVTLHEDDFITNKYQTKKQRAKEIIKMVSSSCVLEDWMIAKKAKTIPPENYDKAQFANKSINSYSQNALNSIKTYSFEQFCNKSIKKSTGLLFFKEKSTLNHKADVISQSLTHMPDQKVEIAVDLFELLLKIGGEKEGDFPLVVTLWKFIATAFAEGDDICEEAYFQVIKQWSSRKKIYIQVLACMSATIQPTVRMYLPLLNLIYTQSQDPGLFDYRPYYNFIFYSLIKTFSCPRKAPPSMFELYCLMNLRKIPILMCFPRQNIFFVQFYSTVEELLQELVELYGLSKTTQYLISLQGVLLMSGSILDGLNKNSIHYGEYEIWEKFQNFRGYHGLIVIKNMMDMYKGEQNFLIMFNYIVYQYRKGLFSVSNKVAFQIGGLIIVSEIEIQDCYEFNLAKCLPKSKYKMGLLESKIEKVQELIMQQYFKFEGTKRQARKAILQKLSKSKGFLTHFFYCTVFIDQFEYQEAWVGLKSESLLVVEPGSGRLMLYVHYENIRKWGRSSSELCLKIDGVGDLHIQSNNLDVLISIFTNYIIYLQTQIKKK